MSLVNTILIGAQKSGTTTLYDWLAQHPDAYGPRGMKDFPFFCDDMYYGEGIKWFESNYPQFKNKKAILHGNVNYLYFSQVSAKRIYQYNSNTKLIVLLRNPVDRAYSSFWQQKKVGNEDIDDFNYAIEKEKERCNGTFKDQANLTYIDHGFYANQLKKYYEIFPSTNIKVIIFEEMIHKNAETISDIYKFMGIDPYFKPNYVVRNESGMPRFKIINNFLREGIKFNLIKNLLPISKRILIKNILRELNTTKTKYEPLDREVKSKLIGIYKNDINELENLLDRDLKSLWLR